MEFLNAQHHERFSDALTELAEFRRQSPEWQAALFLLTGNGELWRKARRYLDGRRGEYHWLDLLDREDLTGGQETMVRFSVALYNGSGDLRVADLWTRLDAQSFALALSAARVRRGGLRRVHQPVMGQRYARSCPLLRGRSAPG